MTARVVERPIKRPGPDHPIIITPEPRRVSVHAGGAVIADSVKALSLAEASYPAVAYIPRADADMSRLTRSAHTSWCPFKGEASYFHVARADGSLIENAVWTYEAPHADVAAIKDHLAFYPSKVEVELR